MKKFVFAAVAFAFLGLAATTDAQVWTAYRPVVGYPAPYAAYYAPAPVTAYYAPAPVPYVSYYAPPVAYYRAPVVVPPRYFYPGQPVRNVFRRPVIW